MGAPASLADVCATREPAGDSLTPEGLTALARDADDPVLNCPGFLPHALAPDVRGEAAMDEYSLGSAQSGCASLPPSAGGGGAGHSETRLVVRAVSRRLPWKEKR